MIGDPAPVIAALTQRGARVEAQEASIEFELDDGDPFSMIMDVLVETNTGMRSLGARKTTLEDIFLAGEEDMEPMR